MRSEWRSFPLTTITFLGEPADITGPEPGVLVAEQTTERRQRVDANVGSRPPRHPSGGCSGRRQSPSTPSGWVPEALTGGFRSARRDVADSEPVGT